MGPSDAEVLAIVRRHSPPPYVKSAALTDLRGGPDLPDDAYADPAARHYPTHTAAATWAAAACRLRDGGGGPDDPVWGRITKAARWWGIAPDVARLTAPSPTTKAAADRDDDYAFVATATDGAPVRQLPIPDAAAVKSAAAALRDWGGRVAAADRRMMAARILDKAAALDVDLGDAADTLTRWARRGTCAAGTAARLLGERAAITRHTKLAAALTKLAAAYEARDPQAPLASADVDHLVETLDAADRLSGRTTLVDRGHLPRAEDVLCGVTRKVAAAWLGRTTRSASGAVYDRDALGSVRLATVRARAGTAVADRLAGPDSLFVDAGKAAAVLPVLRRGEADAVDVALAESGVVPVGRVRGRPYGPGLAALTAAVAG